MRTSLIYILVLLLLPSLCLALTGQDDDNEAVHAYPSLSATSDSIVGDTPIHRLTHLTLADTSAVTMTDSSAVAIADSTASAGAEAPARSRVVREKVDLETAVEFSSVDSMLIIRRDSAFMYGESTVKYGSIELQAEQIEMNLNNNTVYAVGREDSVGEIKGKPIFTDNGTKYEASTMDYNFRSGKGFITNVVTQQGEGYLTGGTTKKTEGKEFYIQDGFYSTCDNHEHPHFGFQLTKAKVNPGKNIVTGPAYMVLAGLPLPLAVPFGYFPFTESYSSGVIIPSFGDDYNRGFYLSNGGYYFAISDNIDAAITGEIYTKGSWGLQGQSNYVKRYKYSGNFRVNYLKTITGEKGDPDYTTQTNFQVVWSHTQDAKANPNMNLSASVNFATSGYSRNDLGSYYSPSFTENTKSSTVNLTYRIPNSKWSFSTSLNVSQRTQDSTLAVSFPNLTVTMSQLYPFKRKKRAGDEKWYEKIKMSYSGQFQNSLTAQQDVFFKKSLIKDWRNAFRHEVPISATFNALRYINITPSLRLTDRMYSRKVRRHWDEQQGIEICDTNYSFYNVYDFTASLSLDTKVYGFFQPIGFLGKKIKMIRHVMTPSVSLNYSPDFASPFFGYYGKYRYNGPNGEALERRYSYFPNALYGVPGEGMNGSLSFSLANNLEMKVKSDNDSIGEKKISLIENLSLSESYNFAADSMNWSDLNTSILLRVTKGFNLNLSAIWDVYTYKLNQYGNPVRVNIPRWKAGKGIGRLRSTGTSFSYTFNNDTFKRKKDKNSNNKNNGTDGDDLDNNDSAIRNNRDSRNDNEDSGTGFTDGYMDWTVPWSLSVNYSIGYSYGAFNKKKLEFDGRITQNLSFSGNIQPTKNWNFSFSASYNFDTHKIAYMNCNISRDLHCFTMSASFVPVGPYKSYNFHIAVKSSLLSDLKYDKRSSRSNGVTWY